ncbi:TIR domain-containing protein [Nitrosomonas nitrosa]|uniref:toll/interleukin-1 receptor domain-containing protein n=1 Tax=Nitrosomonas nitrosa TaxID=52442 RepID=UPI000D304A0A|nr:toll/interleukin-1 receptor domain-containing protein [Nitrosomonas nitrosa]PTQ91500.1 TIR domain-containing protein [Nitrosomonas nitrosa]
MTKIFISYRRNDVGGYAGRLCDRLNAHLGEDSIFMDVEDIHPGQDFVRAIDDTVAKCDYLLVLIGPRWLETLAQRSSSNEDFVHHEIVTGLTRNIQVIPVLVAGAKMPGIQQMPADLAELSRRQAIEIRDDRFDDDVARLIRLLEIASPKKSLQPVSRSRLRVFAVLAVFISILIAGIVFLASQRSPVPEINGTWIADMQKSGRQPYRISLTFVHEGRVIRGIVDYPTGNGVIQEGTVEGESLTFSTLHTPQFESEPAVIHFTGKIKEDGIYLTSTDDAGIATGIARKKHSK